MIVKEKRIAVLEDDPSSWFVLKDLLEEDYELRFFQSIQDFEKEVVEGRSVGDMGFDPQLMVLDLRLPDGFVTDAIKRWADLGIELPPFFVISGSESEDEVRACFKYGAADFITKPYSAAEIIGKVENVFEKQQQNALERYADQIAEEAFLTVKELKIFKLMVERYGSYVTRQAMIERLWPKVKVNAKTLDVHLHNLRKKLEGSGFEIQNLERGKWTLVTHRSLDGVDEEVSLKVSGGAQ